MRVMTFNLRFDNADDGLNGWDRRRDLVLRLIDRYAPSILGTQEGLLRQLAFLNENLADYALHAPKRPPSDICQYPTLFFRRGEIDIRDGSEFWLSKTPQEPGSKDWDSAFPRMMSFARVSPSGSDRSFWVVVTHLDHVGEEARFEQARIIARWVRERKEPVVLMGDFNDQPGSPVHDLLTSSETGLRDSWQVLARPEGSSSFTHHGFRGIPQKARMDWILVSAHFRVLEASIIRDHDVDRFPSDHFPYMVDLGWE